MYVEIRGMLKQKYGISAIAKKLNISRTTVYRYLEKTPEEMAEWCASTMTRSKKLDKHKELILHWLREYPDLTAAQVYDWLQEKYSGCSVGESTVRNYVKSLRDEYDIPRIVSTRSYEAIPDPPMGEQMQVDFGFITVKDKDGKPIKMYFIVFVLSHSRYKYVEWLNRPFTTKDVVATHKNAFIAFNGVTKEVVYDQDRLMVVSENVGDILLTEEFQQYVNEMKFNVKLCRKADPESKGKVENVVGFVKKNFANNRIYHNIDSWNEQSRKWLERTGNGKMHNGTKKRPAEVFLLEKQHLRQVISKNKNNKNSIARNVRKDNTVLYLSNRYSVPLGTFHQNPEVHLYTTEENILVIYVKDSGVVLAKHQICSEKGELIQNRSHRRDRTKGIEEYMGHTSQYFSNQEEIKFYLNELKKRYSRYFRDQLTLLNKCIDTDTEAIIDDALTLCIERELFSANDFRDVVNLLKRQRQVNDTNANADDFGTRCIDIAEFTIDEKANQRPIEQYVTILEEDAL